MLADVRSAGMVQTRGAARRRVAVAVVASASMAVAYSVILRLASGSTQHLIEQVRTDWFLLAPIAVGFGIQVSLVVELRRRRAAHRAGVAAAAAGAGTSAVGMLACCAHHIADLAPFLGLSAAAPFLYRDRVPVMLIGLAANGVGIAVAARRLRHITSMETDEEIERVCASH